MLPVRKIEREDVSLEQNLETPHIPVLLSEVLNFLNASKGHGVFVDGTFGAGGYSQAILEAASDNRVLAIDRDPSAILRGQAVVAAYSERLKLVEGRFGNLAETVRENFSFEDGGYADGVVLDIGVSSMQIDDGERGFSFQYDGPLDMRMEQDGRSAASFVNEASEEELADIFHYYGEERRARAMARAIVQDRVAEPFTTTRQLAALASRVIRADKGTHAATRIFQALRIAVNDELGQLVQALYAAEQILRPGGRLVVVTFHSLEDRIVKQFLANRSGKSRVISRFAPEVEKIAPSFMELQRKPVVAQQDELLKNPRARSAKLRVAVRTEAASLAPVPAIDLLASLPEKRTAQKIQSRVSKRRG